MRTLLFALFMLPTLVWGYTCNVSWDVNDPADEVTKYTVYVKNLVDDKEQGYDVIGGTETTCANVGLGNTTDSFQVTVTATNQWGESDRSNAVRVGKPSASVLSVVKNAGK